MGLQRSFGGMQPLLPENPDYILPQIHSLGDVPDAWNTSHLRSKEIPTLLAFRRDMKIWLIPQALGWDGVEPELTPGITGSN